MHDPDLRAVPPEILKLKELRGEVGKTDCQFQPPFEFARVSQCNRLLAVNFSEYDREPSGKVALIGRVKFVPFLLPILHA